MKKEFKKVIDLLIEQRSSEKSITTGFNLLLEHDYLFTEQVMDLVPEKITNNEAWAFLVHFATNVLAVIESDDLFPAEMKIETPIARRHLPDGCEHNPSNRFTHFMILPLDYNRPGTDDLCICWTTKVGRVEFSPFIEGDY